MKPRPHTITFNTPLATCWLEAKALCISSNNLPRTKENIREHYQILKGIVKKKICWINGLLKFSEKIKRRQKRWHVRRWFGLFAKRFQSISLMPCRF